MSTPAPYEAKVNIYKRVAVTVVGGLLTLAGIAALVLPGPGFLLVAAGLAVLATQYKWARKPLRYAQVKAEQGMRQTANSWLATAFAVATAAALIAFGILVLSDVEIPYIDRFLGAVTAWIMIASGAFLVGLTIYAHRTMGQPHEPPPA